MKKSLKSAISTLANKFRKVSLEKFNHFSNEVVTNYQKLSTYVDEVNDQIPNPLEFEEEVQNIVNKILGADRDTDDKAMFGEYYTADEVNTKIAEEITNHYEEFDHVSETDIDQWIKDEVEERMTYYVDRDEIDEKIQEYVDENCSATDRFGSKLEDYDLDDINEAIRRLDENDDKIEEIETAIKELKEWCNDDAIPQPNESEYAMMKVEILTLKEQVKFLNAQMGMLRQIAKEFLEMNGYYPTEEE